VSCTGGERVERRRRRRKAPRRPWRGGGGGDGSRGGRAGADKGVRERDEVEGAVINGRIERA
jgi:hypothetical protein